MNKLKEIYSRTLIAYQKFSAREKMIIIAAVAIFLLMGLYQLIDSAKESFLAQTLRLEAAEIDLKSLPPLIVKYSRSKARRDQIEAKYKAVEIPEGALSLLEKLANDKAKPMQGSLTITPRSSPFGSQYKQTTYIVKFRSSQVSDLVNFLKEVVSGSRPLLLTRLDITKSFAGDRLDIEADISSIEKKSAKDET